MTYALGIATAVCWSVFVFIVGYSAGVQNPRK
jgi:hypothetical protein